MDQFRLILILIGVALLLIVYYLSRRSSAKPKPNSKSPRRPQIPMSGHVNPPELPYQVRQESIKPQRRKRYVKYLGTASDANPVKQGVYDQIADTAPFSVTVYVMPLAGVHFRREQVVHCMQSLGCVPRSDAHYDYLILDEQSGRKVARLFTVKDAHEPGIFSHDTDAPGSTNGLVFDMQLPGPIDSIMAFEKLLDIARVVATKLNGVVCDDLQNRLTKQATTHIKDRIIDFNRKLRTGQIPSIQ